MSDSASHSGKRKINSSSSSASSTSSPDDNVPSDNNDSKFKRKRAQDIKVKINNGIVWEPYVPPSIPRLQVMDVKGSPRDCWLHVGHSDRSAITNTDHCSTFKQNQFQLHCKVQGSLEHYTTPSNNNNNNIDNSNNNSNNDMSLSLLGLTDDNTIVRVEGLYLYMYAYKQEGDNKNGRESFEKIPVHQAGPSRTKKESKPPPLLPLSEGEGTFKKLQFQASTRLGSNSYFRVVVCLVAKVGGGSSVVGSGVGGVGSGGAGVDGDLFAVCASQSPKLTVMAKSPGKYVFPQNDTLATSNELATTSFQLRTSSTQLIPTLSTTSLGEFSRSFLEELSPDQIFNNSNNDNNNNDDDNNELQPYSHDTPNDNNVVHDTLPPPPIIPFTTTTTTPTPTIPFTTTATTPTPTIQFTQSFTELEQPTFSIQPPLLPQQQQQQQQPSPPQQYHSPQQQYHSPQQQQQYLSPQHQQQYHSPQQQQYHSPLQQQYHSPQQQQYHSPQQQQQYHSPQQQQQYHSPQQQQQQHHSPQQPLTPQQQYPSPQQPQQQQQVQFGASQETTTTPPTALVVVSPPQGTPTHAFHGRVGINTDNPQEALSVNGNLMVTGDILKPSDYRLKCNFESVSPAVQLKVISTIKIYDYDIHNGAQKQRDRGVIAQELAKVLPAAVHQLSEFTVPSGEKLENLHVVNERVLLFENIGATQQLHKLVNEDRERIEHVAIRVEEIQKEQTEESNKLAVVSNAMQSMATYVLSEELKEPNGDTLIHCGISLFGLGPAWSLFLLGFVFPPMWVAGCLYMWDKKKVKKAAGVANFFMISLAILGAGFSILSKNDISFVISVGTLLLGGITFLAVVSYYRIKKAKLKRAERRRKKALLASYNDVATGEVVNIANEEEETDKDK